MAMTAATRITNSDNKTAPTTIQRTYWLLFLPKRKKNIVEIRNSAKASKKEDRKKNEKNTSIITDAQLKTNTKSKGKTKQNSMR